MKKFAFSLILAAACSLPAMANDPIPSDTGCNVWSLDDGYYKACVNQQGLLDAGYYGYFQDTNENTGGPGVVYVRNHDDGSQDIVFFAATPDYNDCKRNDEGGCIDPNPN